MDLVIAFAFLLVMLGFTLYMVTRDGTRAREIKRLRKENKALRQMAQRLYERCSASADVNPISRDILGELTDREEVWRPGASSG